ncbi:MAG: type II toxin-antitoxin system RelE/ParE family toxin [Verrucomicrobia bacterium]|nr:type II toxin-antitoxin system RelE/ParE family toxin [Verrucomicrobiota bacterium]
MELKRASVLKPLLWAGSSLKDLREMPDEVKADMGHSLREIQKGKDPGNIKPLTHLGISGIWEIVTNDVGGTFRAIYTVKFADAIVVLHVFQKKSKKGISTPKQEINLILERFNTAKNLYLEWKGNK